MVRGQLRIFVDQILAAFPLVTAIRQHYFLITAPFRGAILIGENVSKLNDYLVIRIKLVSTLLVIQRQQSLPGSFIIRLDASCGDICRFRIVILIQFVTCESQEDITMRGKWSVRTTMSGKRQPYAW